MNAKNIGRALGIGMRVAGRIAGQRVAAAGQPGPQTPLRQANQPMAQARAAGSATGQFARNAGQTVQAGRPVPPRQTIGQGIGGFLRPFRRVGGILWLEITGVFFLLPVVVFGPALWRAGVGYTHTSDHRTFWITAVIVAVFLYLGVSSFWRAHRR